MKVRNYYLLTSMGKKIVKCTSKGQITLPKKWRDKFKTMNFLINEDKGKLIISPIEIEDFDEEVLWDANRDNNGKGIPIDEVLEIIKEIQNDRRLNKAA